MQLSVVYTISAFLDHNQVEKECLAYDIAQNGHLVCGNFYLGVYVTVYLAHVILDARPFRFSRATLKSWVWLGTRLIFISEEGRM